MKKIVSNLMLAGLVSIGLAACNSGGGSTSASTSANTTLINPNQNNINGNAVSLSASSTVPTVINMIGGDIINAIVDPATGVTALGTQLLGLLTGTLFPSNPGPSQLQQLEAQNAQMFSEIQSNLGSIENTLATQGQLLQTIYQTILTNTINGDQITLTGLQNGLTTSISEFNSVLEKGGATQLPTLLNVNNNQTLTLSKNDISALIAKDSVISFINNFSQIQTDSLDTLEQTISADSAAQYSATNPALHAQQTQIQPSPSNNLLLNSLQNAFTSYSQQITTNTQNGVFNGNLFESQAAWDNTVDSTILGMITTLNAAYRIDQVKLYLYYQTNKGIDAPSVIYTPDLSNYQSALADLTYAYNQRLANLATIDTNYKMMLWNQLFPVLGNNLSESSTCNLNNNYLSSLTSGAAMGSWNGVNLTISCQGGTVQSNGQNIQPVLNTNFTPSIPCNPNSNGIYSDLAVTKAGYIICGTNSQDWNLKEYMFGQPPATTINGIIQNQISQPNIASSQYSIAYVFTPLPDDWVTGNMSVTLPGFDNGITGLTFNMIGYVGGSGILGYNPAAGSYSGYIPDFWAIWYWGMGVPPIYYDNYHALMLNAACSENGSGGAPGMQYAAGCGVALACIPGLSDCTGQGAGGSYSGTTTLNGMNLSTLRSSDKINFANGDTLTMQISNIGQPNNGGNATLQYSTN